MKIYHNPRCSKSRETLALLKENNIQAEVILYLEDTPNKKELTALIKKLGIKPIELIRKGEAIYKEKYKGQILSDKEWIEAMVAHPKLIERPIVVEGNKAILGRPPSNVLTLL